MVKLKLSIEGDATEDVVDAMKRSLAAAAQGVLEQPPIVINNLSGDSVYDASGVLQKRADDLSNGHNS